MSRALGVRTAGLVVVGVALIVMTGCPLLNRPGDGGQEGQPRLIPFESSQELLSYFKQQASVQFRGSGLFGFGLLGPTDEAAGALGDSQGDAANGDEYSTTNVQEEGVDESDVFKSDGTRFYIADGQTLRIVRASPAEQLAEIATLDLGVHVESLYLQESMVIALGMEYAGYDPGGPEIMIWPPYHRASEVVIWQIDVSDPTDPVVVGRVELDGSLVSSRLTNGRLIVVLTIMPDLPENPNALSIGQMTLDEVMPKMRRSSSGEGEAVQWERWLRPESPDGYNMTAVVTLDASDVETVVESVAVLANAGTIYASTEALYLTDAEYDPDDNYREQTAIHKFDFDENGAAQYVASGSVPGRLLNQFSLGEYDGHLRVATHVSGPWFFGLAAVDVASGSDGTAQDIEPPEDFNAVYVLRESERELVVTGTVEQIAPGEQLHSARFMGDHGFLVTFRKIDPLFVLDLGDPNAPRVVGELKVPGFSDYLHPVGEDHLIGVGNWTVTTEWGFDWFQGVQVSLFDVSDWSAPTAVEQITLGGRGSESETDRTHKAFTFMPASGLLALPMQLYTEEEIPWDMGELTFDGVVVFQVDTATGFEELGRVGSVTGAGSWTEWRRAAFIGDNVYALTPDGVRGAGLEDFSATHEVAFSGE